MKILHITPSYKPAFVYGGPTMSVSELCEKLSESGHDITVFTTTANGKSELVLDEKNPIHLNGVSVFYFKRITKDHTHFSPELLYHLFMNVEKYDVVHIHSWWNLVSLFAALILSFKGKKFILSPRGMLSPYTIGQSRLKKMFLTYFEKFIFTHATFHATSVQESKELETCFIGKQIFILPNYVRIPLQNNTEIKLVQDELLKLLFISRIDPKKGLEKLFQILVGVKRKWKLIIAGSGEAKYIARLKTLVEYLGIHNKIEWRGFIHGDAKFQLYHECYLTVLISKNENFANVIPESVAMGTPVLVSPSVGLSDWVLNKKVGWVSEDNEEILKLFEEFQSSSTIAKNTSKNGYAIAKDSFYSESLSEMYIREYQND